MDDHVSLMNKPVNDLTVGDALKINLATLAIVVGVPVLVISAAAAKDAVKGWNVKRKAQKNLEAVK